MVVGKNRNAKLIINRKALYNNIHHEKQRLGNKQKLFMVVKANGYGQGAVEVAKVAKEAGANGFCVAMVDEGIELRENHLTDEPILVLGFTPITNLPLVIKYDLSITVSSLDWLKAAVSFLSKMKVKRKVKIHLALDTGMGRIGVRTLDETKAINRFLVKYQNYFELEGVFTHFASADSVDSDYFNLQVKKFKELRKALPKHIKYVHMSNSSASFWHELNDVNVVRFGIGGYGVNPSDGKLSPPYKLEPSLSFTSEVAVCKEVPKGSKIGYGSTYTTKENSWIGTVPVGYADGIKRNMQGFKVLVLGQKCEIIGRICMDQLMIKLPFSVPIGTPVTFIGKNKEKEIKLEDWAKYGKTISYEIMTNFSNRLPRIYES